MEGEELSSVPFVYSPFGSARDIHISCRELFPEEKNNLKIFVLSSIVAAKCEFGQGVCSLAP